jgi:hypothetical protein
MHLIAIGWLYVALMMAVAEATSTNGTVLGAIVTLFVYGLLPIALVLYLMGSPVRSRAIKAREAAEQTALATPPAAAAEPTSDRPASDPPDAGGEPAAAAEPASVSPVRKEP